MSMKNKEARKKRKYSTLGCFAWAMKKLWRLDRRFVFFIAARTRSFASRTVVSGKPTISNATIPFEISVWTHTGNPSIPINPQEYIFEIIMPSPLYV